MNRNLFDLTENRVFHKKPKHIGIHKSKKLTSIENLLFGHSASTAKFLGKIQSYDEKSKYRHCDYCGKALRGFRCNCMNRCDRCGKKLQYNQICLCSKCEKQLELELQRESFLHKIRGIIR